jgi:amino acid transporter
LNKKKLTLLPLCAATYFMVSGGPYGLEELIAPGGYGLALIALILTPLVWSLPTAMMVGELAAALPEEGGYYAWVRRALGPFWGFQEAWLSLLASVFDMAIYPTLFTAYLARLVPALGEGHARIAVGAALIAACALLNMRGARAVGGASIALAVALLGPFVAFVVLAVLHPGQPTNSVATTAAPDAGLLGGVLVAMWNYQGWDNASTVAGEVERPQRTYPLAMLVTVGLVTLTYVLPVWAASRAGVDPSGWTTGAWVVAARAIGGRPLEIALVAGGMICGAGMLNALVLSYSRVPAALAADGWLPSILARKSERTGAPWVSIIVCSTAWAACLGLGFARLVQLDVACYGLSLALEFVALFVLRLREPKLERPFRVPGGLIGAGLVGVVPMALLLLALVGGGGEGESGASWLLWLCGGLVALGPAVYWLRRKTVRPVAAASALP